jgi:hypothetical protein
MNSNETSKDNLQAPAWGFLKNIINIDTFFAAPKSKSHHHHSHSNDKSQKEEVSDDKLSIEN